MGRACQRKMGREDLNARIEYIGLYRTRPIPLPFTFYMTKFTLNNVSL